MIGIQFNTLFNILTVGSHIDSFLISISKYVKFIIGIRAHRGTYKFLQTNIKLNDIENAKLMSLTATEHNGIIEFLLSTLNRRGSNHSPKIKNIYYYNKPKIIEVSCTPLDATLKARIFDLIIMDIKDSEYFALQEYLQHHLKNVAKLSPEEFFSLVVYHLKYYAHKNSLQFRKIN